MEHTFAVILQRPPAAEDSGNMTLRPNSVVHEISYDEDSGKATGVKIIDAETMMTYDFKAKIVFVCASAIEIT